MFANFALILSSQLVIVLNAKAKPNAPGAKQEIWMRLRFNVLMNAPMDNIQFLKEYANCAIQIQIS